MNQALTPLQVEKIDLDLELTQHSLLRSNLGSIPEELSAFAKVEMPTFTSTFFIEFWAQIMFLGLGRKIYFFPLGHHHHY